MNIKEIRKYVMDEGLELTFRPALEEDVKIKKTKKGYEVRYLTEDPSPLPPNKWSDGNLFLVNYHRDFWVEDEKITKDQVRDWYQGEKIPQEKDYYIFQIAALIHSGVWLSLNRSFMEDPGGWDTSHVGAALISKESKNRKKAIELANSLIKEWNMYLQGDVYGTIKEIFNKKKEQIDCDGCWGYYGYDNAMGALKEM